MAGQPTDRQWGTPLRYPGGKGRLTQYVSDLIKMNDLVGGHYAEPYAGGASIGIALMYLEYVSRIHLNDINRPVFSFWKAVCEQTDDLARMVRDKRPTMTEWKRQKKIYASESPSTLELAFATFFLNRTNRSGIIRGGVIGGQKQTGTWKIDARYNRDVLARRIEKIGSYAPRISLYNMDAGEFIKRQVPKLPKKSLVYLDPPYYAQGKNLYEDHYQRADHKAIADVVGKIKQKWIVSYDNVVPIKKFYSGYEREVFSLNYSAQDKYRGSEIMVFCPELQRPMAIEPTRSIAA